LYFFSEDAYDPSVSISIKSLLISTLFPIVADGSSK